MADHCRWLAGDCERGETLGVRCRCSWRSAGRRTIQETYLPHWLRRFEELVIENSPSPEVLPAATRLPSTLRSSGHSPSPGKVIRSIGHSASVGASRPVHLSEARQRAGLLPRPQPFCVGWSWKGSSQSGLEDRYCPETKWLKFLSELQPKGRLGENCSNREHQWR